MGQSGACGSSPAGVPTCARVMPFRPCYPRLGPLPDPDLGCSCVGRSSSRSVYWLMVRSPFGSGMRACRTPNPASTSTDTPVRRGGQAGAWPDRTRSIPGMGGHGTDFQGKSRVANHLHTFRTRRHQCRPAAHGAFVCRRSRRDRHSGQPDRCPVQTRRRQAHQLGHADRRRPALLARRPLFSRSNGRADRGRPRPALGRPGFWTLVLTRFRE